MGMPVGCLVCEVRLQLKQKVRPFPRFTPINRRGLSFLQELASQGKPGFYCGRVARAVSQAVQQHGGLITVEDLQAHQTTFDDPISTSYRGVRVWEMPPSGQGLTALMALNILEGFDLQGERHKCYTMSNMKP